MILTGPISGLFRKGTELHFLVDSILLERQNFLIEAQDRARVSDDSAPAPSEVEKEVRS
jgi:hypothetical protein